MRVGIASTHMWSEVSFRNAGISKSSYRLIDALADQFPADKFTVFANSAFETSEEWAARSNLRVRSVVPMKRGTRAIWEFFGSGREARTGDYDVWFSTSHIAPVHPKIPTVAIIHDMIPLLFPQFQDQGQRAFLRFALTHVARRSSLVITNSEQTKSDIVRFSKVNPKKIRVVPFGPGMKMTARCQNEIAPEELSDIPYKRFFFSLGTLEPRKNLSRLLEAMTFLSEPEYADVGLVIGGGRGWREQGIFDTLDNLGIRDRVTFLGYLPDERIPTLFAASEGFVFPSIYEGFGMPIVESMQAGTVVLTSSSGAMSEVAGDAAILFDPYSPEDISRALKRCLGLSSAERTVYLAKGTAQSSQFNWEEAARQTRQALFDLL